MTMNQSQGFSFVTSTARLLAVRVHPSMRLPNNYIILRELEELSTCISFIGQLLLLCMLYLFV